MVVHNNHIDRELAALPQMMLERTLEGPREKYGIASE
jgi:hypothetical protein